MPSGTYVIDSAATFSTCVLLQTSAREKFGSPGVQDTSAEGVPKWAAAVAVTFTGQNGLTPVSDVLQVGITSPTDPAEGIQLPAAVTLVDMRLGVSSPEKRDNGSVRGGRPWHTAAGIRPVFARSGKSDAA